MEINKVNRPKRKRGRPPKGASQKTDLRRIIIDSACSVCCEKGVHGLTVERILKRAGTSRPTFYKFFRNKDEVIDLVSREVNQKLVDSLNRVMRDKKPDEAGLEAFVDAYLDWGMEQGAIVGRLYQGMKAENSFISKNRETTVHMIISVCQEAMLRAGKPAPDALLLDAMIYTGEYLCNPLFTDSHSKAYYKRVRRLVIESLRKILLAE